MDLLPFGSRDGRRLPPIHWPYALSLTIVGAVAISQVLVYLDWTLGDMHVYRAAGQRILDGAPLYSDAELGHAYRYAPWFGYAWVPMALLPEPVVSVAWSLILLGASAAALSLIAGWSPERVFLVVAFTPLLFAISTRGNIQPLIVLGLMLGLNRRWGWVVVGLAASLKVAPLAFCAVFIAQRRWWSVIGAVALTVALWAPIALHTLDPLTFAERGGPAMPTVVGIGLAGAAALVALWLAWRRSSLTALAAATAAVLAMPRLFLYDASILMPSVPRPSRPSRSVTDSA